MYAKINCQSFVKTTKPPKREGLVVQRQKIVWTQRDGLVVQEQCRFVLAERDERAGEIVACIGVGRIKCIGLPADGKRFFEPSLLMQGGCDVGQGNHAALPHVGVVGLQLVAEIEIPDRFLVLFEFEEQTPAPACRVPMTRVEPECLLESQDRVCRTPRLGQRDAEALPELRVIRFELHRFVEHLQRILKAGLSEQCAAETYQVERLGIATDRTRNPLHRAIELLGIERQQSHQVQAVRMIRGHRKRLFETALRVARAARQLMGKTSFVKSGRRTRAGGVCRHISFSSSFSCFFFFFGGSHLPMFNR